MVKGLTLEQARMYLIEDMTLWMSQYPDLKKEAFFWDDKLDCVYSEELFDAKDKLKGLISTVYYNEETDFHCYYDHMDSKYHLSCNDAVMEINSDIAKGFAIFNNSGTSRER